MDMFGYVLFGIVFGVSTVITHYLLKHGEKYSERIVIAHLEKYPDIQQKVKDRFGWR